MVNTGKVGLVALSLVFLTGCAYLETSSGKSNYKIAPLILTQADGSEIAACCELSIFNSKDIGAVIAKGEYDPLTGKITFELRQEMVDASTPTKVAMENQMKIYETVTQILKFVSPLP